MCSGSRASGFFFFFFAYLQFENNGCFSPLINTYTALYHFLYIFFADLQFENDGCFSPLINTYRHTALCHSVGERYKGLDETYRHRFKPRVQSDGLTKSV